MRNLAYFAMSATVTLASVIIGHRLASKSVAPSSAKPLLCAEVDHLDFRELTDDETFPSISALEFCTNAATSIYAGKTLCDDHLEALMESMDRITDE